MKTTKTPASKSQFLGAAALVTVVARMSDGTEVVLGYAQPRAFSTGSVGWFLSSKASLPWSAEHQAQVQVGLNLIAIGTKDLPAESPATYVAPEPTPPRVVEGAIASANAAVKRRAKKAAPAA